MQNLAGYDGWFLDWGSFLMLGIFSVQFSVFSFEFLFFTFSIVPFPENAECLHLNHRCGWLLFSWSSQHLFLLFFCLNSVWVVLHHILGVRLCCCCDQISKVNGKIYLVYCFKEHSPHSLFLLGPWWVECLGNGYKYVTEEIIPLGAQEAERVPQRTLTRHSSGSWCPVTYFLQFRKLM